MNRLTSGVIIGEVTDNKDPDKLARVKVKFLMQEGEEVSDWARIAFPMAGKDRGTLFIPEVGDQVLLAFKLGEVSEPYIIGALWTKDAPPPDADYEKNNIRTIKSRSGHVITFLDKEQEGSITIQSGKGHQIVIDDKADKITVADAKSKNNIVIQGGDSGSITVTSQGSGTTSQITLKGSGDIVISGSNSVKITSTAKIDIESSGMMNLKATGNLSLQSDAMVTIKGTMVKIN